MEDLQFITWMIKSLHDQHRPLFSVSRKRKLSEIHGLQHRLVCVTKPLSQSLSNWIETHEAMQLLPI